MSSPKFFKIKETESELKKLIKNSHPMIAKRLQALLIFKRNEDSGVSKRLVADEIGVNHNSVQTWRSLYIKGVFKIICDNVADLQPIGYLLGEDEKEKKESVLLKKIKKVFKK